MNYRTDKRQSSAANRSDLEENGSNVADRHGGGDGEGDMLLTRERLVTAQDEESTEDESAEAVRRKVSHANDSHRVLTEWLERNLEYPYPTHAQKEDLAKRAGLQFIQVAYWFTNARRRILPSLIQEKNKIRAEKGLPLIERKTDQWARPLVESPAGRLLTSHHPLNDRESAQQNRELEEEDVHEGMRKSNHSVDEQHESPACVRILDGTFRPSAWPLVSVKRPSSPSSLKSFPCKKQDNHVCNEQQGQVTPCITPTQRQTPSSHVSHNADKADDVSGRTSTFSQFDAMRHDCVTFPDPSKTNSAVFGRSPSPISACPDSRAFKFDTRFHAPRGLLNQSPVSVIDPSLQQTAFFSGSPFLLTSPSPLLPTRPGFLCASPGIQKPPAAPMISPRSALVQLPAHNLGAGTAWLPVNNVPVNNVVPTIAMHHTAHTPAGLHLQSVRAMPLAVTCASTQHCNSGRSTYFALKY